MGPDETVRTKTRRTAIVLPAVLAVAAILAGGECLAAEKLQLKGAHDEISYSVGYQVGGDFKRQGIELNAEAFVQGIRDAAAGTAPLMSPKEMSRTLVELKKKVDVSERMTRKEKIAAAVAEGEAFLAENAKKEGVVTLRSGLQYKVLKGGTGKSPKATDAVTVEYKGTLIDGTEFDSSYRKGKPATLRLDSTIAGWKEALPLMKEGARWQLVVPPKLAYGDRGPLEGKTVIFEVELLSVDAEK